MVILFVLATIFAFVMMGYSSTGEKVEGTNEAKYTFIQRLMAGDIYVISVVLGVSFVIALTFLILVLIGKGKRQARSYFLERVAQEKANLKGFLYPEELKEKGVTPITVFNIRIACVAFNDHIHFQWQKITKIPSGNLVIYRRTGGFAQDRFSQTDNGIRVEDNGEDVWVWRTPILCTTFN